MRSGWKRNRRVWNDGLSELGWQDFERLIASLFEGEGYQVEHCGTAGTGQRFDGGVDLVLRRAGETVLVQCKHWNAGQVTHNAVHELIGIVETRQASAGILVSSGEFTPAARTAASSSRNVSLIDGVELRERLGSTRLPQAAWPGRPGQDWSRVADKALDAGMFLATRGAWPRRGRAARPLRDEIILLLVKLAFGAVMALLLLAFIRHQAGELKESIGASIRPAAPATPRAPPPARVAVPSSGRIEAATVPATAERMTPEQLEEEKRKNAEAMEILERTTPSVYD